jgi:hypothetical protein
MTKDHILAEIRRTASENGGVPLGRLRFQAETGIREADWRGIYWVRWNDALKEAGLPPNRLQAAYDQVRTYATFIRELDHFPVVDELKLKARRDGTFPNPKTFARLGNKRALAARVAEWCRTHGGYDDVVAICTPVATEMPEPSEETSAPSVSEFGSVYLLAILPHALERRCQSYQVGVHTRWRPNTIMGSPARHR